MLLINALKSIFLEYCARISAVIFVVLNEDSRSGTAKINFRRGIDIFDKFWEMTPLRKNRRLFSTFISLLQHILQFFTITEKTRTIESLSQSLDLDSDYAPKLLYNAFTIV